MAIETTPSELTEPASSPDVRSSVFEPSEVDEVPLIDLLIVLARRKGTIFGITAVFFLLSLILSMILPKRYTSTVTLLPPQQGQSMSATLSSQLNSLGGNMSALAAGTLGLKNPNDMYVAMFRSRTVEDSMVQKFGLMAEYHKSYASDARQALEARVAIDGSGKDSLIHISVEDPDPRRAAELANGYVEQFRLLSAHLAVTEASRRRLFFEQQLQEAKDNLANAEGALEGTERKTGLNQLDSQTRTLIEMASSLRAQISAKEVQIQGMQSYATGENAELIEAERELDEMRTQLAKLGGSSGLIVPTGQVPQAGLEYIRKLRDVRYYETIFDILARQYEAAKLDEAREGAVIQVVDLAVPPDRKSFPRRSRIVIAATLGGLICAVLFVLLMAGIERMMRQPALQERLSLLWRFCLGK
jgi:tyrosine-protein kinase Etk/Wzc